MYLNKSCSSLERVSTFGHSSRYLIRPLRKRPIPCIPLKPLNFPRILCKFGSLTAVDVEPRLDAFAFHADGSGAKSNTFCNVDVTFEIAVSSNVQLQAAMTRAINMEKEYRRCHPQMINVQHMFWTELGHATKYRMDKTMSSRARVVWSTM